MKSGYCISIVNESRQNRNLGAYEDKNKQSGVPTQFFDNDRKSKNYDRKNRLSDDKFCSQVSRMVNFLGILNMKS